MKIIRQFRLFGDDLKRVLTKISQKSDKIINHKQNGLAHMNCYSQKAVKYIV
jgi:hypothetical protein